MIERLLLAGALWLGASAAYALDGGRYGEVKLAEPVSAPRGYVVLFSDAGGWTAKDDSRLDAIAKAGALAVGVDTDAYLDRAASFDPRCLQLLGDAEGLSRQLQRERPGSEYFFPVLAGVGRGGALVGAILAQAPKATVGAGVSLDPWASVGTERAFCPRVARADDPLPASPRADVPVLVDPWTVVLSPTTLQEVRARFDALTPDVPQLTLSKLGEPAGDDTLARFIAPTLIPDNFGSVAGLPLVELPVEPHKRRMAILISGDGGWRDIDRTIAEQMQKQGLPVVGWDALRYFWSRKTPDETAADLAKVIAAYGPKWNVDEVALVGFSFGADVLPFLYPKLPPALRQRVKLITLLSPSPAADWEIRVVGWLGAAPSAEATPLAPALKTVPAELFQCFYGDQDHNSSCAALVGTEAEVIEKKGQHHFDGDYAKIAREILAGFDRRGAAGL
jgi:type IV secretory pathway VirJ component